ncbi:GIY-YIG nuclease family protein [bacterium]|nr:GIY-YIG nuclease family protein [bacterium]
MPRKPEHCVYVLLSLHDSHLYIGYTTNLKRRLTEHFDGRNTSTACRRPVRLIFCEYYLAKSDALRREAYFKTTAGKRALRLMLQDSLADQVGGDTSVAPPVGGEIAISQM